MGKINIGRVILGGLLAGLIINILEFIVNEPILGNQWKQAMEALNRPEMGTGSMIYYVIISFALGIAMIWLYAAIRPRYGAGPKTAIWAGIAVWFFAYFSGFVGMSIMGLFPGKLVLIAEVWGFFELIIASVIGAWVYKEE